MQQFSSRPQYGYQTQPNAGQITTLGQNSKTFKTEAGPPEEDEEPIYFIDMPIDQFKQLQDQNGGAVHLVEP